VYDTVVVIVVVVVVVVVGKVVLRWEIRDQI